MEQGTRLLRWRWRFPRHAAPRSMALLAVGGLLVLFALATLVFRVGAPPGPRVAHLTYDAFLRQLSAGNVKTATIDVATQEVSGVLRHAIPYAGQRASHYATALDPQSIDAAFRRMLTAHGAALARPRPQPLAPRLIAFGQLLTGLCGAALLWLGIQRLPLGSRLARPSPRADARV